MIDEMAGDERSCPCSALALRRKHGVVGPVRRRVLRNFDRYLHVRPQGLGFECRCMQGLGAQGLCSYYTSRDKVRDPVATRMPNDASWPRSEDVGAQTRWSAARVPHRGPLNRYTAGE